MNRIPNSREPQLLPIDAVKPYGRHARRHSKAKIDKLKKLLAEFGQVAPILVDGDKVIISGHALHTAMRELGAGEIAAISIVGRSQSEIKALRLALNRLPLEAAWDDDNLRAELQELVELSFDLDLTGFDAPEIDSLLDLDLPKDNIAEDDAEIPPIGKVAVSSKGDIWVCGRHRLGCGDALDQVFVDKLRGSAKADLCFIDPPYNEPIGGFVSGKGRTKHREFVQAAGEMSSAEFIAFLTGSLKVLRVVCTQRALIYACMNWRHVFELIGAGRECGLQLFNLCVWAKTNAGMGSLYRNQHELICVFMGGTDAHENKNELGRHCRNRSNLWNYRVCNAFSHDRDALLASHPTVKPVSMIADALRDVTKRGDIVIDTFMGSGSTLMAAEKTGRICFGTEIDPLYVDVAIRRWQVRTASDAVHAMTGELFSDRTQKIVASEKDRRNG